MLLLPAPHSLGYLFLPNQVSEPQPHNVSQHQPTAYDPAHTPHDLAQLDCYFCRLALRSISQEVFFFLHCQAGYSRACSADGVVPGFYGQCVGSVLVFQSQALQSPEGSGAWGILLCSLFSLGTNPLHYKQPQTKQYLPCQVLAPYFFEAQEMKHKAGISPAEDKPALYPLTSPEAEPISQWLDVWLKLSAKKSPVYDET